MLGELQVLVRDISHRELYVSLTVCVRGWRDSCLSAYVGQYYVFIYIYRCVTAHCVYYVL